MHAILGQALAATAELWPALALMFAWIARAAALLDNPHGHPPAIVRVRYRTLLQAMSAQLLVPAGDAIRGWTTHFLKITDSYWHGLFHCYSAAGLPRTDNDLEHLFGTVRHRERRVLGRKVASSSLIVRGAVRILAAVVSWVRPVTPQQLAAVDPARWREERRKLDKLRHARVLQRRFRRDPESYLADLEERLVKLSLPP
jgi:hypothetical protein